jgi:hypothetical protein
MPFTFDLLLKFVTLVGDLQVFVSAIQGFLK